MNRGMYTTLAAQGERFTLGEVRRQAAAEPEVRQLLPDGWHEAECVAGSVRQDKLHRDYWLLTYRTRHEPHLFAYARMYLWCDRSKQFAMRLLAEMLEATGREHVDSPREFMRQDVCVMVETSAKGFTQVTSIRPRASTRNTCAYTRDLAHVPSPSV